MHLAPLRTPSRGDDVDFAHLRTSRPRTHCCRNAPARAKGSLGSSFANQRAASNNLDPHDRGCARRSSHERGVTVDVMQPVSPLSLGLQLDADGRDRVHRGALVLLVTVVLSALVALCLAWAKGRDRSVDLDASLVGFGLALLARIATIAGSTWLVAAPAFTTSTKGLVIGRRIRWGSAAFAMAFLVPYVVPPMSGLASGLHFAGGAIDACFWIVLALALRDLARAAWWRRSESEPGRRSETGPPVWDRLSGFVVPGIALKPASERGLLRPRSGVSRVGRSRAQSRCSGGRRLDGAPAGELASSRRGPPC